MKEFWLKYRKLIIHYTIEGVLIGLCITLWQVALRTVYEHFGYIHFYTQLLDVGFILFYFMGRSINGRYSRFF